MRQLRPGHHRPPAGRPAPRPRRHRRTIGCQRAGVRVLGFVAGDEGDERADRRARLIEQWNENHHREPMTVTDETTALLALFEEEEMTEAAIAKATGLSRSQVTASLTVARSKVAQSAADRWDFLTLDQAATLAEFDSDDQALTAGCCPGGQGQPQPARPPRRPVPCQPRRAGGQGAFTAELEAEGSRGLQRSAPTWPWHPRPGEPARQRRQRDHPGGTRHLPRPRSDHHLRLGLGIRGGPRPPTGPHDGRRRRRSCPRRVRAPTRRRVEAGFAARLAESPPTCARTPTSTGTRNVNQVDRDRAGGPVDQVKDKIKEEEAARIKRRQVIAGNKQWRAATAQRQDFLRTVAARKTPPARALTWVLAAMGGCDWDLINALQKANSLAGELLGFKAGTGRDKIPEMITQASDKRATVIALIILLAGREIPTADEHIWRKDEWQWSTSRKTAAPYLAFLRDELGYTLSPIEAAVEAGEQFDPLAADAEAAGQDGLTGQDAKDQAQDDANAATDTPAAS